MSAESGETKLATLLSCLQPQLLEGEYVFCLLRDGRYGDLAQLNPLASFSENEGLSLVLSRVQADDAGLAYSAVFRCVTLTVHSSLEAVGLTAAVAGALAGAGISANVIAAHHHDHVLVPADSSAEAMAVLEKLSD